MVFDINPIAFSIFNFPIYWYSIFFAIGFYGTYIVAKHLAFSYAKQLGSTEFEESAHFIDTLSFFLFVGMIIGARLGHILFYEPGYYWNHLIDVFNLRKGGLSSHGGIFGLLFALWIFEKTQKKTPEMPSGRNLFDLIAISSGCIATCIRIGNFFNQEIIGTPSTLPWAILFTHPVDGGPITPRHPSQLYEAITILTLFLSFLFLGRNGRWASNGRFTGWYLILLFSSRLIIETTKTPQCAIDGMFTMGQMLSLPMILLGGYLVATAPSKK